MKNIALVCLIVFSVVTGWAQEEKPDYSPFEKGQSLISLGAGFPNTYHAGADIGSSILGVDKDNGSSSPQIIFNYEYGLNDDIGIGIYTAYFTATNEILSGAGLLGSIFGAPQNFGESKYSVVSIGGKLAAHRELIRGLDTYATTYLGYNIVNQDDVNIAPGTSFEVPLLGTFNASDVTNLVLNEISYPTFTYEINAGGRYFFDENFAIFGEAGIGRYLVHAGLTYRLN